MSEAEKSSCANGGDVGGGGLRSAIPVQAKGVLFENRGGNWERVDAYMEEQNPDLVSCLTVRSKPSDDSDFELVLLHRFKTGDVLYSDRVLVANLATTVAAKIKYQFVGKSKFFQWRFQSRLFGFSCYSLEEFFRLRDVVSNLLCREEDVSSSHEEEEEVCSQDGNEGAAAAAAAAKESSEESTSLEAEATIDHNGCPLKGVAAFQPTTTTLKMSKLGRSCSKQTMDRHVAAAANSITLTAVNRRLVNVEKKLDRVLALLHRSSSPSTATDPREEASTP